MTKESDNHQPLALNPSASLIRMVVGLGNPGRSYERTRHNVGFEVVDELARRHKVELAQSSRWDVELAEWRVHGHAVELVKPLTFMNASGPPVAAAARKRGWEPGSVLVVYDDVDLPIGQLRLRKKGSAGGHNGIKSMIAALGTQEFPRLRVGVGRPVESGGMVDHVLSRFTPDERKVMVEAIVRAADAVEAALQHGLDKAMNEFNG